MSRSPATTRRCRLHPGSCASPATTAWTFCAGARRSRPWCARAPPPPPAPTTRADDALEQAEGRTQLAAAIARLPDDHREALLLFHQEQLSYREIAAVLEVPIGTVMTWLHRARQKLRAELQEAVQ
jgi:RNA polymerase sigma factor (sigma-70 family)